MRPGRSLRESFQFALESRACLDCILGMTWRLVPIELGLPDSLSRMAMFGIGSVELRRQCIVTGLGQGKCNRRRNIRRDFYGFRWFERIAT